MIKIYVSLNMEQKDYILREIEKIRLIIAAIRQKLWGDKENLAIALEKHVEEAKGMLLSGADFELDMFLNLNEDESNAYIDRFEGFSVENIELLAEDISRIGFEKELGNSKKYLEKALQLYELCKAKGKTYSFERETKTDTIKRVLQQN